MSTKLRWSFVDVPSAKDMVCYLQNKLDDNLLVKNSQIKELLNYKNFVKKDYSRNQSPENKKNLQDYMKNNFEYYGWITTNKAVQEYAAFTLCVSLSQLTIQDVLNVFNWTCETVEV